MLGYHRGQNGSGEPHAVSGAKHLVVMPIARAGTVFLAARERGGIDDEMDALRGSVDRMMQHFGAYDETFVHVVYDRSREKKSPISDLEERRAYLTLLEDRRDLLARLRSAESALYEFTPAA